MLYQHRDRPNQWPRTNGISHFCWCCARMRQAKCRLNQKHNGCCRRSIHIRIREDTRRSKIFWIGTRDIYSGATKHRPMNHALRKKQEDYYYQQLQQRSQKHTQRIVRSRSSRISPANDHNTASENAA